MKSCPTCKMTVDADNECPICQATLTYEPSLDSNKEKLKLNRYLFFYLFKNLWLSVACIIAISVKMILAKPVIDRYFVCVSVLALLSLLESVFRRKAVKFSLRFLRQTYAEFTLRTFKITCALAAVIIAFFIW